MVAVLSRGDLFFIRNPPCGLCPLPPLTRGAHSQGPYKLTKDISLATPSNYKGVLFVGDMEVCTDQATKDFLWREGFERYYPKGITDPDHCVLKFTASQGSLYDGLRSTVFTMNEGGDVRIEDKNREELTRIITKFAQSGWDLIEIPSREWLAGKDNTGKLKDAIAQADKECGSCGCEYDLLYKRALALIG